jgi:predicted MPP superfamily phosphohydrolase
VAALVTAAAFHTRFTPGLRLLHVSDLHAGATGPNAWAIAKFDRASCHLNPDIILFTGDLAGKKRDLRPHLGQLAALKARYGKFAVLGNHDHGMRKSAASDLIRRLSSCHGQRRSFIDDNPGERVARNRRLLMEAGIWLLDNECAAIEARGEKVQICGMLPMMITI